MGRLAKRVSYDELPYVAEYLVSRVNRAKWQLSLHPTFKDGHQEKTDPGADIYRLAARVIDLGLSSPISSSERQDWLNEMQCVLDQVNAWIDKYFDSDNRKRLRNALRVAKHNGTFHSLAVNFMASYKYASRESAT